MRRLLGLLVVIAFATAVFADVTGTGTSPTGGGGGASFPISTQATFGTANGAANSISFNETAGAITFEGSAADANKWRMSVGALDQASSGIAYSVSSGIMQMTSTPNVITMNNSVTLANAFGLYLVGGHISMSGTGAHMIFLGGNQTVPAITGVGAKDVITFRNVKGTQTNFAGKSVTESSATAVVLIPVASGSSLAGEFHYTVHADDSSVFQDRTGWIKFGVYNPSGTETCTLAQPSGTTGATIAETQDTSFMSGASGTLTYSIACDTSPTNGVNITFNAVSSLTQTTLTVGGILTTFGSATQTVPSVP